MTAVPRMRMFAGPNGSGKSTMKSVIGPELLGVYINPDDIEKEIRDSGFLDLKKYGVSAAGHELSDFFKQSVLLKKADLVMTSQAIQLNDDVLDFSGVSVNSYYASVISDFLRHKLLDSGISFTFETVMSSPDKVALLRKAQERGFRTYLYFVATDDPMINISRVRNRVRLGGHPVPEDKIVSRYGRSLGLLLDAIRHSDRAYIFDNSSHESTWLAEVTNGEDLELRTEQIPAWFKSAIWDRI
ncbi:zeta toxin family protein [Pseudomonas sp. N3-W]|uniref:Zeta toxin family protein n=1 Tax=Pseudomonas fungipugnans TaxID=3024217 RepID=A0ABT6QP20_9PSED|nr:MULTISPECIES: zeta toxin family protein [unclassified Pseudomonas]MDI2592625.1 zeta toxin family protein [Pseudomonas sp. 681]UWF49102.1 zeta toxin family protein [Pseudomonas sp. N3-W]